LGYIRKLSEFYIAFPQAVGVNPYAAIAAIFNNYCAKTPDGNYCMDRYIANIQSYSTISAQCTSFIAGTGCTTTCKTALTTMANTLGCCTTAAFGFSFPTIAFTGFGFQTIQSRIFEKCGLYLNVTSVGSCSKYLVSGTLVIKNLVYAYYQSNSASVGDAIKADLSLKLGVDISTIIINSVTDATVTSAAVSVSYTVTPSSTSEATSIVSALSTSLSSDTTLTTTSTLDLTSKSDSTAPASADATTSSQTSITNPVASDEVKEAISGSIRTGVSMIGMVVAMLIATLL
jgi:hypothetical protein